MSNTIAIDISPNISRRRGRPDEYDPKEDQMLFSDWISAKSKGISRVDFASSTKLSLEDLVRAIDRHRVRIKGARVISSD
jgi:hypothetical protein